MFPSFRSALLHILIFFALLLPHGHKMAAMASDMMSSLHGPLKEETGAKEKEGVRVGERMRPPEPH